MRLEQKIAEISGKLESADLVYGHGSQNARDEAIWIALHSLDLDLIASLENSDFHWQQIISDASRKRINQLVQKRIDSRSPLAYLINETWFMGHKFYIDERTIVPRSYLGEWIPEGFSPWVNPEEVFRILDLCTGCGCIAIGCALAFPQVNVVASDISSAALEVARMNVLNYDLSDRVKLNQGDCFAGIEGKFDLIVCNPPYVSNERMDKLPPEFGHEPDNALRAGNDGLEFIQRLLDQALNYLTKSGTLVVEAGSASHALEARYPDVPFTWLSTEYDEFVVFALNASELGVYKSELSIEK